jgi:hypothetical protein
MKELSIFYNNPLYSLKNKNILFLKLISKLTKFHYQKCYNYKKILKGIKFSFKKKYKLSDLPFVPIKIFKNFELLSTDKKNIIKVLRSSGTSGNNTSKIFLDKTNSINQIKVLNKIINNVIGKERLPMLIVDKQNILFKNEEITARIAGINGFSIFGKDHTYLLDKSEKINYNNLNNFIEKYSKSKFIIFGFTSLIYENLIKKLNVNKIKNDFKNAVIFHGGGWKKLDNLNISNKKFKSLLKRKLKINQIINYYGMVEQTGSIFLECSKCDRFVTTEFADIIIRNKNLEVCKTNQIGTVQTLSCLPTSYPGHNILTEDIGEIKGENNCPCGKLGKYFLIHGRIKEAEMRGCSNVV